MGKRAEQAKKRKRNNDGNKSCAVATHSAPGHPANPASKANSLPSPPMTEELGTMVDPADLMVTVDTIQYLCENPDELVGKEMKELKRGVHELYRVMVDGAGLGTSLTSKISSALQDYRFTDALVYLFEMYTRAIPPKLGALQRWVRECDATDQQGGGGRDKGAMKCLDMILRIAGMEGETSVEKRQQQRENEDEALAAGASWTRATVAEDEDGLIRRKGVFRARGPVDTEIKVWELVQQGKLFDTPPPNPYPSFKAVHHLPGHMRKPPNLYSSTVYASEPGAIVLHPAPRPSAPRRVDVPGVPGAFVVLDVFTPEECLQIVKAAEGVGFEKDEAAGGSAINKQSILAKNFVWLADKPFLEHFYSQILPFVPPSAPVSVDGNGGGHVRGINARFRVYQYTENQVYRAHIDGAWPAAGLDKVTGEYLHDSSPPDDPLWSRYTLLVYLNSDIPDDSGCTTFFMPSDTMGVMEATSVKPIQGAVLCFPHGDTQGSLLHEGSGVTAGGGKFVIRTDLLYEAKGFGQYKPPASVGVKQGGKGEEGIGG